MIFDDFPRLRKHAPLFEAKIPSSWVAPELLELQLQRLVQWPCGKKNGNHVSFCWDTVSLSICEYMWIHVNVVISLFYWGFDISYQLETLGVFLGVAQFFFQKDLWGSRCWKIPQDRPGIEEIVKACKDCDGKKSNEICSHLRVLTKPNGEWWWMVNSEQFGAS